VTVADLTRINQWIDTTLKNDLQLAALVFRRVYSDEAPQGGAAPLVVYAFLGGADKQVTSRGRLSSVLYLIRAINDGSSYDSVEAIADRIEAILQVPDEGTIIRDVRISPAIESSRTSGRMRSTASRPSTSAGSIASDISRWTCD
jgi:hypothetical protein